MIPDFGNISVRNLVILASSLFMPLSERTAMFRLIVVGFMLATYGCDDKKVAAPQVTRDAAPAPPQEFRAAKEADAKRPAGGQDAPPERKIIYTARVELHIANLDDARGKLDTLLAEVKGYVSKSDESGRTGGSRSGTWKVRVPVGAFHDFLARVQGFGELISKTSDAQDVTEEFVDTEARLKNLKAEEVVLNKLLQEKAQSTADLLAFRKQISDVREQIERHQARLETMSRLSAMTTIDLVMREDKPYVPDSAPTFGTSLGRTFGDSVDTLERLGKGLILALVALAPWSPIILLALWLARRPIRTAVAGLRDAFRNTRRPAVTTAET